MAGGTIVNVALQSASYNIILQVLMRIVSSLSNMVILRIVSKDNLGVINVRLMLLYSTAHCLSREAFRRSCLSKFDSKSIEKTLNLLWLTCPTCLLCSLGLRIIWLKLLEEPNPSVVPHYAMGVNVILLSVIIEILAEPLFVFSQSFHFVKLKVFIEGISLTLKSICMVVLLCKWPDTNSVMYIFCLSQMLSSIVYTSSYYAFFWWHFHYGKTTLPITSLWNIFPKLSTHFLEWKDFVLTWSFLKQTLLKQFLTEGERYVMTFFNMLSLNKQGLYDTVNNLGSLAARFIFLPIEESGYLMFSQLVSRDQPPQKQKNFDACLDILANLMKMMTLMGLIVLTFGYSYSSLLLLLYGGPQLSTGLAPVLLRWHCFYVLLLALNGITECFKLSAMSPVQIDRYNQKMVFLSVLFLFAAYCLAKIVGSVGFILANCLNMGFRIIHSIYFIKNYFKLSISWFFHNVLPKPIVIVILLGSFLVTAYSEANLSNTSNIQSNLSHLSVGICCFGFLLFIIWCQERNLIKFFNQQWFKSEKRQKIS